MSRFSILTKEWVDVMGIFGGADGGRRRTLDSIGDNSRVVSLSETKEVGIVQAGTSNSRAGHVITRSQESLIFPTLS
jgi:hypothetical protein